MRMYFKGVEYSKHEELLTTNMEGRTLTVVCFRVEDGATFDTEEEMRRYITVVQRRESKEWQKSVVRQVNLDKRKCELNEEVKHVSEEFNLVRKWLEGYE